MTSLCSGPLEWKQGKRFGPRSHGKRLYRLPNVRRNRSRKRLRFEAASRSCQIFDFANEIQTGLIVIPIDTDVVSDMYLIRSEEIGKRIDNVALNRQLETLRAKVLFRGGQE